MTITKQKLIRKSARVFFVFGVTRQGSKKIEENFLLFQEQIDWYREKIKKHLTEKLLYTNFLLIEMHLFQEKVVSMRDLWFPEGSFFSEFAQAVGPGHVFI